AVTVIDHFSKYAAAYPVPDKTAETIAKVLFVRWIAEGCRWPKTILSDKGGEFENKVMAELTKITKIGHVTTKGYNPRENGITERLNGTIVAMLRRSVTVPVEWDVRLPFCMMAYNCTPHSATGDSPYFILHGMDPNFPSEVIPNGGISWYSMDKSVDDYKAQLLQAVAEAHERVRDYNNRVREEMKRSYDLRNKVDEDKLAKVGDRVYLLSPREKGSNTHPKLTSQWAGPFRVIETSQNSALVTRIGENTEPIRVQLDALRVVPSTISDDRIDTVTSRGKRGRKPKVCVKKVTNSIFSGAVLASKDQKGHLQFTCKDGCLNKIRLGQLKGIFFPGALANQPLGTIWDAWRAASIFIRTDIDMSEKIQFWRDGAVLLEEEALQKLLKVAYENCFEWTEFVCMTSGIRKHEKINDFGFETIYDAALKKMKTDLQNEERDRRVIKDGPVAFAAPPYASLLEKDGPGIGILTKVVRSFRHLSDIIGEWKGNKIWIIVWPLDKAPTESDLCSIVKSCYDQFQSGGRVITAWPPLVENNEVIWKNMVEMWTVLDETLAKQGGPKQCITTANSKIKSGKVLCEKGTPEDCLYFYKGR
ncbi:unnamed protein product, partial [Cylicostephanus goldi]